MNQTLRKLIENVLPPFATNGLLNLMSRQAFHGTYASFQEALAACGSKGLLQDQEYVDRAFQSDHTKTPADSHHMEVLAAFALALLNRPEADRFRVLDFGGGPANFYFFMRNHLPQTLKLRWDLFDTEVMVKKGRETYAGGGELSYYSDWKDVSSKEYDVILLSGALQLCENPWQILSQLAALECRYLVAHEIPITGEDRDLISIKWPPPVKIFSIHRNYPLFPRWFFSEKQWLASMSRYYDVAMEWPSGVTQMWDGKPIGHKSFLFEKKARAGQAQGDS